MKHVALIFTLSLLSIILTGCSQSSSTSKKDSSNSNPVSNQCAGIANYQMAGCPGYCQMNPTHISCTSTTGGSTSGSTSGSTTGSTTGATYNGTTSNSSLNWGARYDAVGKPSSTGGSCSAPTGSGYDLRKGTVTMALGQMYAPNLPFTSDDSMVTSSFFINPNEAKGFFDSDSILRVRFKPRPQPQPRTNETHCFGRTTGSAVGYGYTKLSFSVALKGVNADGTLDPVFRDTKGFVAGINSCTTAADWSLSGARDMFPNGVVVVVYNVQSNQGCSEYLQGGQPCAVWAASSKLCWAMDIEAQVDGTKAIP